MNPLGIRGYASRVVEKIKPDLLPSYALLAYQANNILKNIDWNALNAAIYKFSVERGSSISSPRALIATMCLFGIGIWHIADTIEKKSEKREKVRQEKITAGMDMFYSNRI